jgi:hypothetical protein
MKARTISSYTGAVVIHRIGRYEIESELGRGGFGLVYRARDPAMERSVAIKLLLSPLNPDAAARFRNEAIVMARVPHKNIVTGHDIGEDAGRPFLVMEYLDGETLRTKIDSSSLSLAAKIEIISQLAEGLHFRHPRCSDETVFVNRYGEPLTASGFRFRLRQYVAAAACKTPTLSRKRITPHVFRHTTAVHLISAGVDVTVIRSWLGHVHLETTNHYAQASLEMKRKALEQVDSKLRPTKPPRWKQDANLLAWLDSL